MLCLFEHLWRVSGIALGFVAHQLSTFSIYEVTQWLDSL